MSEVHENLDELESSTLTPLDSPAPMVAMHSTYQQGDSGGTARAVTTVDSTIEECASWELSKMSREGEQFHLDANGLARKLVHLNPHRMMYRVSYDLKIPNFDPREFLFDCVWRWESDKKDSLIVAYKSATNSTLPSLPGYLRAKVSHKPTHMCATHMFAAHMWNKGGKRCEQIGTNERACARARLSLVAPPCSHSVWHTMCAVTDTLRSASFISGTSSSSASERCLRRK